MARSGQLHCLLLAPVSGEIPVSPQLTLEKTSCSKSAAEIAQNKNRGFRHGTVVKTFGRLYNEFLPTKEVSCKKMESEEHTRCPRGRWARQVKVGAPSTLVDASCPSRTASYFPIFLNIPKRRKLLLELFWSRFTYRTTYLFLFGV